LPNDVIACVAFVCTFGILWSRIALGAHYLSDVAGGIMLGFATLELISKMLPVLGHVTTLRLTIDRAADILHRLHLEVALPSLYLR